MLLWNVVTLELLAKMLNSTLDFSQFAVISWRLKKMENRLQHKNMSLVNKEESMDCFETSPLHFSILSLMISILNSGCTHFCLYSLLVLSCTAV